MVSRDCCLALPHGAIGLSVDCDCGISWSYSLTFLVVHSHNSDVESTHENLEFIIVYILKRKSFVTVYYLCFLQYGPS